MERPYSPCCYFIISKMQYNVLQYNNLILHKNIKLCSSKLKIESFFQGL